MHESLLLLPLCSSLPPESVLCSAEPAKVQGPLLWEAITLLAGLLLGRQAKKLLSGSRPAAMPTASTRRLFFSSKQQLLWHKLT